MRFVLSLLFIICIFPIISADLFPTPSLDVVVGFEDSISDTGVSIFIPEEIFNSSAATSNSTNYWNTGDRGPLRNVADILHSWLDATSLLWSNAGHTMDTDLDMDANDILDVGNLEVNNNITVTNINASGIIITEHIVSPFENKSNISFLEDGSVVVTLDPIIVENSKSRTILSAYEVFKGWRILSSSGNESVLLDSYIKNENQICVSPKQLTPIVRQECKTWNNSKDISYDKNPCLEYKNVTYSLNQYKNSLPIYDLNKNVLLQDLKRTFSSKDEEICYDLNPYQTLLYKLGLESIIIDGETSYNSIDENITQETGFAHLSLNDSSVVLYMPFDSNVSQSTAYDYSTNDNDGTISGAVFNSSGKYGGAYDFDGVDDTISIPYSPSLTFGDGSSDQPFSFNLWININNMSEASGIITKGNNVSSREYFLRLFEGKLSFFLDNQGDDNNGFIGRGYNTSLISYEGQWIHIAMTYSGNESSSGIMLYLNGERVDDTDYNFGSYTAMNNTNSPLYIGSRFGSNFFVNDSIDEVRIYNRSLSADEVNQSYNTSLSRFFPEGTMLFNNTNVSESGNETRLNITLAEYQNLLDTNISVSVNGTFFNLSSDGTINFLDFTGFDPEHLNITFKFTSDSNNFYTPLMIGNITLDAWEGGAPPVDNKTTKFIIKHWLTGDDLFSIDLDGIMTFVNGETIDNLVDGFIRVNANLWTTGNLLVEGTSEFQDNISVDGIINATGIITGDAVLGEMYQNASSPVNISIVTAGTYYVWNQTIVNDSNNVYSYSNGTFVIQESGYYNIAFSISIREGESQCIEAEVHKNNVPLAPQSEIRQTIPGNPEIFPTSIINTTGTILSGTINEGKFHDGQYILIAELGGVAPAFILDSTFIDAEQKGRIIEFVGIYNGLASHLNKVFVYNNQTGDWDGISALTNDFPSDNWKWQVPRFYINGTLSDYYNVDNEIIIRLDHISSGNANHRYYFDSIILIRDQATTILTNSFPEWLNEGDIIDLRFTCPINSKDIQIINGNFNIARLN